MAVRVADVHFAHVPFHVGRRPSDIEAPFETPLVDGIDVVHPDRHPSPSARPLIAARTKGDFIAPPAAAALTALAKKYLAFARANATKCRRITPVPAKLFKPGKALNNIRYVQYWRQAVSDHIKYPYGFLTTGVVF